MAVLRLVQSADFERVLRSRVAARSEHFALHHVADSPLRRQHRAEGTSLDHGARTAELSTQAGGAETAVVDDTSAGRFRTADLVSSAPNIATVQWLGAVVPKRHARRAVTRSLIKRQIRSVVGAHAGRLAAGLWIVRLRAPFDRAHYVSAASDELRCAARRELDDLVETARRRHRGATV